MVAQVIVSNHYGPDCSYKGFPRVTLAMEPHEGTVELPTTVTRVDHLPEEWVDLRWTGTPDGGREYEGREGYFLVYTTQLDTDGKPCPDARMTLPDKLTVRFPPYGDPSVVAVPAYEGPNLSTCDGRIGVTPIAQAPPEVSARR